MASSPRSLQSLRDKGQVEASWRYSISWGLNRATPPDSHPSEPGKPPNQCKTKTETTMSYMTRERSTSETPTMPVEFGILMG